ncbi:MAG: MBL fold metallo-hydrolase, partial [Firmicutes bacterium]|nr:MBL fold metallo-hydrolase [Bacillota bacterium]
MNETILKAVTINSHSSIRIAVPDRPVIYVDPFHIGGEPRDADLILVTHPHFDHFSEADIERVRKDDTAFVMPMAMFLTEDEEIRGALDRLAFTDSFGMEPNKAIEAMGVLIESVPSYNVNKPNHLKEFGWIGYLLTIDDTHIYIAGDTDINDDVKAVRCDIALIPAGGTYTTDAKEAAELANAIGPEVAIPTHYADIVGGLDCFDTFKANVDPRIRVEQ